MTQANYSIMNLSECLSNQRIDAEFFLPQYLENEKKIESKPYQHLTDLVSVSDGNHLEVSKYFTEDKNDIPYYRGQDLRSFFLESADPVRIPHEIYDKGWMKRSYFYSGDVLMSIVGTIGSISYVTGELKDATGSCKLAILRPKDKTQGLYLSAFLVSKYGLNQIKRNVRGAVQTGFILEDAKKIKVINPTPNLATAINEIISKALELERLSRVKSTELSESILSHLGFADFTPSTVNSADTGK